MGITTGFRNRHRTTVYLAADCLRGPNPHGSRRDREYARDLKGKRVALVGPASTVTGSGQGAWIEGHDVVVRLNHALPIPTSLQVDVGKRTDILYHNLGFTGPDKMPLEQFLPLVLRSRMWVCSVHPYLTLLRETKAGIDAFVEALGGRLPFRTVSPRRYTWLYWRLGSQPSAGVSTIQDLLRFDLRELYVTGFTFYAGATAYHEGYRGRGTASNLHKHDAQRHLLKRWVSRDRRLRVDAPMREILFGSEERVIGEPRG